MGKRSYRIGLRFYIFIVLIIAVIGGLCFWIFSPAKSYIRYGSMSSSGLCDAVIIYDEQLIDIPENDRLIYQAAEGELVSQGQTVARLYKKGYGGFGRKGFMGASKKYNCGAGKRNHKGYL